MIKKLEKADGQSMDIVENNIEQLKELFPEVFAEGRINFDRLQEVLGNYVVTDEDHYNFTWHGKRAAGRLAQTPSTGTLRPCPQESVDWDKTQNLFIEGDNLEVLKLLQKSYHRQIKMIYIDPPYNTGNDFVYEDDFKDGVKNYLAVTGQLDDEGKKKGTNSSSAGRYHTNWLNMMYPRLKLARNLLRDDGVIFISIDDNESLNLRKIADEIFGEDCFIADVTVVNNLKGRNDKKYIATANERLFMYVKSYQFEECGLALPESRISEFKEEDNLGKYRLLGLRKRGGADTRDARPKMFFPIYADPSSGKVSLNKSDIYSIEMLPRKSDQSDGCWRWGTETVGLRLEQLVAKPVGSDGRYDVFEKDYLETDGELRRIKPKSVMSGADYSTDGATKSFRSLMNEIDFSSPKPVPFIKDLLSYSMLPDKHDIVLDFFAGSATTAHAVFEQNAEDNGKRRFILVQLPEIVPSSEAAYQAGYKNIADISKERIRRAGKKIKEENPLFSGDLGFKVFKLDTSNIKTWEAGFDTLKDDLIAAADYIKQDRSSDDIVFELLLKYGLDLAVPIEMRMIAGKKVYSIGLGALVVCLDNDVPMETVNGIGALKEELKPEIMRVVFKDSGFKDDVVKTNALQTLKRFGIEDIKSL